MIYSYSKERRSPGWGREDPSRSRGFNSYSKERRLAGCGGREDPSRTGDFNSYSKERRSPGWGEVGTLAEMNTLFFQQTIPNLREETSI